MKLDAPKSGWVANADAIQVARQAMAEMRSAGLDARDSRGVFCEMDSLYRADVLIAEGDGWTQVGCDWPSDKSAPKLRKKYVKNLVKAALNG